MIYACYDEPELGYFGDDEVVECSSSQCGSRDCTGLRTWDRHAEEAREGFYHVREALCDICGSEIPTTADYPLCRRCERTARAHAETYFDGPERFRHTRRETR